MVDETYVMPEPGEGSSVLLTTDHAKSMRPLAWTREYGKSRVFSFGCGPDDQTWRTDEFEEVLRRGKLWCGGGLP
jgi:type 1 glutamine amidotransferase